MALADEHVNMFTSIQEPLGASSTTDLISGDWLVLFPLTTNSLPSNGGLSTPDAVVLPFAAVLAAILLSRQRRSWMVATTATGADDMLAGFKNGKKANKRNSLSRICRTIDQR